MIHHLDPGRMIRSIDLIATGGITRESMREGAATWGTRTQFIDRGVDQAKLEPHQKTAVKRDDFPHQ
jgi:hypothetical protein